MRANFSASRCGDRDIEIWIFLPEAEDIYGKLILFTVYTYTYVYLVADLTLTLVCVPSGTLEYINKYVYLLGIT